MYACEDLRRLYAWWSQQENNYNSWHDKSFSTGDDIFP